VIDLKNSRWKPEINQLEILRFHFFSHTSSTSSL